MTKDELFITHFREQLQSYVSDEYTIKVNWEMDIRAESYNFDSKTIFIVLSKYPSTNYGSVTIQSIMISALCETKSVSEVFRILELYQSSGYNKKHFLGEYLVNEDYYSPTMGQNFLEINVSRGAEITMQGTISFSEGVSDIKELYFFNEKVPFEMAIESWVAQPVTQSRMITAVDEIVQSAKSINQTSMYKLQVRIVNSQNILCETMRDIMHDEESANLSIPVKIVYTDNDISKTKDMIFIEITKESNRNGAPITTFTLAGRNTVITE